MSDSGKQGMGDLEMTKLCAEAMGLIQPDCGNEEFENWLYGSPMNLHAYDPIERDVECFALVKRFRLVIEPDGGTHWGVTWINGSREPGRRSVSIRHAPNLNRAIVECVAKMQATALSTGRAPSTATTK